MKKLFRKLKGDKDGEVDQPWPPAPGPARLSRASSKQVVSSSDGYRPPKGRDPEPPFPDLTNIQKELETFSGFDSWMSSFGHDQRPVAHEVLKIEGKKLGIKPSRRP